MPRLFATANYKLQLWDKDFTRAQVLAQQLNETGKSCDAEAIRGLLYP